MAGRSIYEQIRNEGYRDGAGQMAMVCHDEAYDRGRTQAEADAPKRWPAFLLGVIVGAVPCWWVFA